MLRACIKFTRLRFNISFNISTASLFGSEAYDPTQTVTPLFGLSYNSTNLTRFSLQVMIRGNPKMLYGGSSGWIAIFTPASSAAGITRLMKYSKCSQSFSSSTLEYSSMIAFISSFV